MTGVIRANALALPLPDESVDLIATSPPYWSLRSYRDGDEHYVDQIGSEPHPQEWLEALWAVMADCWRVLKPSGSCFVNLGDKRAGSGGHNNNGLGASTLGHHQGGGGPHSGRMKATRRNAPDRYGQAMFGRRKGKMLLPHRFAIGCEDGLADPEGVGWIVRQDVVWSKLNGLPESVTDRTRDAHEYLFHLTKSERYFAAVDEIREAYAPATAARAEYGWNGHAPSEYTDTSRGVLREGREPGTTNPLGKLPGSVWPIASEPLAVPDYFVEDDRGWRLMDARELWRYVEHRVRRDGYRDPIRVGDIDHFAAFAQALVRPCILGWSPSGICTACGAGRRPVVAKQQDAMGRTTNGPRSIERRTQNGAGREVRTVESATITGYACACPTTAAPTRPAVVLDPFGGTGTTAGVARALGRVGISVDLSMDYSRLARWRIFKSGHFTKSIEAANRSAQGTLV